MIEKLFILVLVLALLAFLYGWYLDYKNYKYQKSKPRILNPWSDW